MTSEKTGKVNSFSVWCDWLTLASYNFTGYTTAAAYFRKQDTRKWKPKKWLQYEGFQCGEVFYGKGIQFEGPKQNRIEKEHYIIKISGNVAGQWLPDILKQEWAAMFYATRIDLEKTRLAPKKWWKPRELFDWLTSNGVKASHIESESHTVYIGARESGRFCRLYEKDMGGDYLRLEIELKKDHSKNAWRFLLDGKTIESIYYSHLLRLRLFDAAVSDFAPDEKDVLDISLKNEETDMESRLKWVQTLIPTFNRMLNDHTIGNRTYDVFNALLQQEDTSNDHTN